VGTKRKRHRPSAKGPKHDVAKRWTSKLAQDGFTPVVAVFLENYARLKPPLTTPEAMLVIHLMSFKWSEEMPWPAFKTLSKRMGISATAVRNHARNLDVRKKYLIRHPRVGLPNRFDLRPLFEALEIAQAEEHRRKEEKEKQARRPGS